MKIILIVGARPNFMKVYPLFKALESKAGVQTILVHTGQHADENMSDIFFQQFQLPEPNYYLGISGGTHVTMLAGILLAFENVLRIENPNVVVVVGDVNSTLACALTAAKLNIPVAHVEAGLRSFDRDMPEEINRIITDQLSTYHQQIQIY
jgi:UDP-N-acetylglucosamine 2-epimerase (non-hydrolysing)